MDSTEICGQLQALLLAGFPSLGIQASSWSDPRLTDRTIEAVLPRAKRPRTSAIH